MTTLPASLRRVLDAQKPKPAPVLKSTTVPFVLPERPGEVTTIWKDGEVWRETPDGKARRLPNITPINTP